MINLSLLNKGLNGVLTPQEFTLLYVISNAINKDNRPTKLFDEMLAYRVGLSVRQIRRWKDNLEEKGFIHKTTKQISRDKRECFYTLNLSKLCKKTDENDDINAKKVEDLVTPMSYYKNELNKKNALNESNALNETIVKESNALKELEEKKLLEEQLKEWAKAVNSTSSKEDDDFELPF